MKFISRFKIYIILCAMLGIVSMSAEILNGVQDAIRLCISTIIPSLFPFMVLSSAFVGNIRPGTLPGVEKLARILFGTSAYGAAAFLCGALCGYPIGAKCAAELYRDGKISASEAETLIACANNCSPLFIIGAVGAGMLSSVKIGILLYSVHMLSAIISAIILRSHTYIKHIAPGKELKSKKLTDSICESMLNVLNVCAFIVFFSVVNTLIEPLIPTDNIYVKSICLGIAEITNGISKICSSSIAINLKSALTAMALGWSGISVHLQVKSIVSDLNLSLKKYYMAKVFGSVFSFAVTLIIFDFPDEIIYRLPPKAIMAIIITIPVLLVPGLYAYKKRGQSPLFLKH